MSARRDGSPRQRNATPTAVYHYTSLEGLLGILQGKKLLLSSIIYSSDSAELSHAIETLRLALNLPQLPTAFRRVGIDEETVREFIAKVLEYTPELRKTDYFVGSFSQNEDLLSQWRGYSGGGAGFSLGFDFRRLKVLADRRRFSLSRCIYDWEEQKTHIARVITKSLHRLTHKGVQSAALYCTKALLLLSPTLKHPSFQDEYEWRLISHVRERDSADGFRLGKSTLIPYKEFDLLGEDRETPLSEVVIGPGPHMDLSAASVEKLLKKLGIQNVRIALSEVPYRNW